MRAARWRAPPLTSTEEDEIPLPPRLGERERPRLPDEEAALAAARCRAPGIAKER